MQCPSVHYSDDFFVRGSACKNSNLYDDKYSIVLVALVAVRTVARKIWYRHPRLSCVMYPAQNAIPDTLSGAPAKETTALILVKGTKIRNINLCESV